MEPIQRIREFYKEWSDFELTERLEILESRLRLTTEQDIERNELIYEQQCRKKELDRRT